MIILYVAVAAATFSQAPSATGTDEDGWIRRSIRDEFHRVGDVRCVFSPNGRYFIQQSKLGIGIRDVRNGYENIRDLAGGTESVAVSPDSAVLAVGGGSRAIALFQLADLSSRRSLTVSDESTLVSGLCFAPDRRRLAVGMVRRVGLFDFTADRRLRDFECPDPAFGAAVQLAFLNRDRLLVAWQNREGPRHLTLFDLITGAVQNRPFPNVLGMRSSFAVAPGGRQMAVVTALGDRKQTVMVDVETGALRWTTDGGALNMSFSPDEKFLVQSLALKPNIAADIAFRILRVSDGKQVREVRLRRRSFESFDYVTGLAFSPDGKTLATCSSDLPITLWDWTKIEAELLK